MAEHTSGPLTVQRSLAGNDLWTILKNGTPVATAINKSDADLYATAPDLLSVLQEISNIASAYGLSLPRDTVERVNAAIRTAEGG